MLSNTIEALDLRSASYESDLVHACFMVMLRLGAGSLHSALRASISILSSSSFCCTSDRAPLPVPAAAPDTGCFFSSSSTDPAPAALPLSSCRLRRACLSLSFSLRLSSERVVPVSPSVPWLEPELLRFERNMCRQNFHFDPLLPVEPLPVVLPVPLELPASELAPSDEAPSRSRCRFRRRSLFLRCLRRRCRFRSRLNMSGRGHNRAYEGHHKDDSAAGWTHTGSLVFQVRIRVVVEVRVLIQIPFHLGQHLHRVDNLIHTRETSDDIV